MGEDVKSGRAEAMKSGMESGGEERREGRDGKTLRARDYSPRCFSIFSSFVLQSMHCVVTGRAWRRFSEIGPPQVSQMPKVPSSIRFGLLHLGDELALAIPDAELEVAVGFEGCPVVGIGEVFLLVGHLLDGSLRAVQEIVDPGLKKGSEEVEFLGLHSRFSRNKSVLR